MARDKPEAKGPARWGVFGGTFDPVHHGHLITAQAAAELAELDRLLLVPTKSPPHRETPEASARERLNMAREAVDDHPYLRVSDVEMNLEEPSYSYRTMSALRSRHESVTWTFIVGVDELIEFKTWHRWEELLEEFSVLGLRRPGHSPGEVPDVVRERIHFLEVPRVDVSSTEVRERTRDGKPVDFLVPDPVSRFLAHRNLYRE